MALHIGDEAPDFTAETTAGTIHFHSATQHGFEPLTSSAVQRRGGGAAPAKPGA